MKPTRWRLGLLTFGLGAAAALAAGCQSESVYFPEMPDAAVPDVPVDSVSDSTVDSDVTTVVNPVGQACVGDEDCDGFTCVNDALLGAFGSTGLSVPNGMCSSLLCDDTTCGEGATCVDLEPAFGASVKICLRLCAGLADCRWEEEYSCAQPLKDDPRSVCLPDNIIVAIECDDGHCDQE
ncbi:MAG: hypothetical protein H6744_06135 [Deltaproteobacteria bacterium]|nr:hypothetical protein [Deltaproteobacteria bacterium]MCB9786258.1 hypothetical protein [Deltaproteobacteria bacterium]